ncbi:sensor histidine kinase [Qipengyuania sp.]|uniref:sensor histidine kinase n=1 Tax=Qipengyuania sp. TaxID=2004515 RepID=UPI0035C86342
MDQAEHMVETNELSYRLDQQRILADFGVQALRARDKQALLGSAVELAAAGMRTSLSKVLEFRPETGDLLVEAGVGWKDGIVGKKVLAADTGSPAGYAFQTGNAAISNHLSKETRFRTPDFMANHGVKRAINILIEVNGKNYGVLEVDSRDPGQFSEADLSFMRGFAHLIGVALERQKIEEALKVASQHERLLTQEASHRIKNSLGMVSSILAMQSREAQNEEITAILGDAQERVEAIGMAHDLLWRSKSVGMIDLADMIGEVAENLASHAPEHKIESDLESQIVSADIAIPVGLVINELITNAVKYAYEDGGTITVSGRTEDGGYLLTVLDKGVGIDGFDKASPSLGMRLMKSLAKQLSAELHFGTHEDDGGTCARLRVPLES